MVSLPAPLMISLGREVEGKGLCGYDLGEGLWTGWDEGVDLEIGIEGDKMEQE